jgi:hypothetical protein
MSEGSGTDTEADRTAIREILLSFRGRKKKIIMPNRAAMEESDVQHLTSVFKEQFDYTASTTTTRITFLLYDSKFNDHLEMDANVEINDGDRMKVVVNDVAASTSFSAIKTSTSVDVDSSSTSGSEDSSGVSKCMDVKSY